MAAFLHVPDKYAGYPISLGEVSNDVFNYFIEETNPIRWDAARRQEIMTHCRRSVWVSLMAGTLHSFVQSALSGAWYRLPSLYWTSFVNPDDDLERQVNQLALPLKLVGLAEPPAELIGQPIVVWRDDLPSFLGKMRDLGEAMSVARTPVNTRISPDDANPPRIATGEPGRAELGVTLYLAELERRISSGTVEEEVAAEARALHAWYKRQYPNQQAPSPRTIENRIRKRMRQHRDAGPRNTSTN